MTFTLSGEWSSCVVGIVVLIFGAAVGRLNQASPSIRPMFMLILLLAYQHEKIKYFVYKLNVRYC